MSNQLMTTTQEIVIDTPACQIPVRFRYQSGGRGWNINREEVAFIAEALCRLATGERRQGIIDLAIAMGIEVTE